jgi:hypothetical protein
MRDKIDSTLFRAKLGQLICKYFEVYAVKFSYAEPDGAKLSTTGFRFSGEWHGSRDSLGTRVHAFV